MKFVITGALGHIGSKLIRVFLKQKTKIVAIDNFSTSRYCSLFNFRKRSNFKFYENDVKKVNLLKILKKNDILIHLAAITDAASSFGKEKEITENNFGTLKKVAQCCLKSKAKLIHLSSTSVYGTQKKIVDEKCKNSDLAPQSPYAACKLKEEIYLQKMQKKGLKFTTLRFGTIIGVSPGMRFHTAVNKFCIQAVLGQKVTVWKTALFQKRPYLLLNDAIRAILFIIKNNLFNCEIYNIVSENLTVFDILKIIKNKIPKLQCKFVANQIMNQLSYEVSSEKIMKKGFKFRNNLKLEINKTICLLQ